MSTKEHPTMTDRIPVIVYGETGRMCRALSQQIAGAADMQLLAHLPARESTSTALADTLATFEANAVICDFTHRQSHANLIEALKQQPRRLVTGTSGLEQQDERALLDHAQQSAVIRGRNFSFGAVLARMLIDSLGQLSRYDPVWQAAVIDFHHQNKLDAQSATARDWAEAWSGGDSKRNAPISSIRLGNGISEHTFLAAGHGERLEIAHRLLSFDAPVAGAMAAIRFIAERDIGLFEPRDLLLGGAAG